MLYVYVNIHILFHLRHVIFTMFACLLTDSLLPGNLFAACPGSSHGCSYSKSSNGILAWVVLNFQLEVMQTNIHLQIFRVSCTALSFFIVSTVLCATSSGISDSNTCHGFLAVYHKFHLQFSCWFQKSQKIRKKEPPPPGGGEGGVPFWQFSFIEPFCGNPKPTGKLLGFMWKQLCMLNFQKLPSSKPFIS